MGKIENTFGRKRFAIDYILQRQSSINPSVVIRVDGGQYEVSMNQMIDLLKPYGIDFRIEKRNYPLRRTDDRPIIDKYIDMRVGKPVNFNHSPNFPRVDIRKLERHLKALSDRQKERHDIDR